MEKSVSKYFYFFEQNVSQKQKPLGVTMDQQKLKPCIDIRGTHGACVGDFWSWAYSDVLSNRNRSIFAEFIVGLALGTVESPRVELNYVGRTITIE